MEGNISYENSFCIGKLSLSKNWNQNFFWRNLHLCDWWKFFKKNQTLKSILAHLSINYYRFFFSVDLTRSNEIVHNLLANLKWYFEWIFRPCVYLSISKSSKQNFPFSLHNPQMCSFRQNNWIPFCNSSFISAT